VEEELGDEDEGPGVVPTIQMPPSLMVVPVPAIKMLLIWSVAATLTESTKSSKNPVALLPTDSCMAVVVPFWRKASVEEAVKVFCVMFAPKSLAVNANREVSLTVASVVIRWAFCQSPPTAL
jgi:hypothetical protein